MMAVINYLLVQQTVWEIAIKRQKGGLHIEGDLQALVAADGFIPLAIDLFSCPTSRCFAAYSSRPF